ncbi:unnamed protein product (macronuclear) [Paramecium tetraurelia]|uniref:Cyclic nucleotide-binding domain-containing protein n=1 Tax=Paramecium tetraurelia TaxID=5888 RepID=A0E696_PARTE|nr:uncharacterized protein GSPATT00003678001 [Paramecium tetraurelia]CAK90813.1 unnamed protein product [Paramecium tetraurelia]|eukprot:XP_001458210.1 hypothetical protein (macronuclear) [Paramecium tetraurelia strain d4-2]
MLDQSEAYKIEDKLLLTKQVNTSGNAFQSMRAKIKPFKTRNNINNLLQFIITSQKMFLEKNIIMSQKTGQVWGKVNKSKFARLKRKLTRKWREIKKSKIAQKITKSIKLIPIINPNNEFKLIWDIFLAFIRFYLLFAIPYETAFNNKLLYNQLLWTLQVSTSLLIFDILLNFITSFYEKGYLITNHYKVARNYIRNGFIYDIFCVVTLVLVLAQEISEQNNYIDYKNQSLREYNYVRSVISILGIIIQLQNIIRVFQRLQNSQDYSETTSLLLDLIKLVMFLFLLEHLFSCIWYFVGIQEIAQDSWIKSNGLTDAPYTDQYITAFYFSSVTMFTVGYGDVVPKNIYERLVTIGFMVCSTLQLSYTVSAIWNVYSKLNEKSEDHIRKMRAINTYMKSVNISNQLKYEIREYLTFYWKEQKLEENLEVKDIIGQLSQDLQENLIFEANSIIVKGCKLFNDYFSHEFKAECLKHVQSITLTPCKTVPFDQPCLFFIERGSIGTYFRNNRLRLATLQAGDNFGLREFMFDDIPSLRYTSVAFSKLVFITKKDFMKVLSQYSEDHEQYCQLKEQLIFNKSYFGMDCYSCKSLQHTIQQCPLLTFNPDKDAVIKKHQYPQQQNRKFYKRKHERKRRAVFKELKQNDNLDKIQLTIPTIESSDSSEFEMKESWKATHSNYFQQMQNMTKKQFSNRQALNIKQIRQKLHHPNQINQPLELHTLREFDDDNLRESDKILLGDLRLKLNQRANLEIDCIKNFKYYYPQFNSAWLFKTTKINLKFFEQWKQLSLFLTFPYEFIKKYRQYILRDNQIISPQKEAENHKKKKRATALYFKPISAK